MKENFTSIIAIVDRSGSMSSLVNSTISGFNEFLQTQKNEPGEAIFTLATFASDYSLVHDGVVISDVPELTTSTYVPGGTTALLDAVGRTVTAHGLKLASMDEDSRPSKVLVLIMTDGEENSSREFAAEQVKEMVEHQKGKYNWEFVFIGANIDSVKTGATFGVAATHSYNYSADVIGTQRLYANVTKGVSKLRRAVASSGSAAAFSMDDPTQDTQSTVSDLLKQVQDLKTDSKKA